MTTFIVLKLQLIRYVSAEAEGQAKEQDEGIFDLGQKDLVLQQQRP